MSQLLINLIDRVNPNPMIDRMNLKKGHVITVVSNNHHWGFMESKIEWVKSGRQSKRWPNKTMIIKVTGLSKTKAQKLLAPQTEDDRGSLLLDHDFTPKAFRRRRWKIDIAGLPEIMRRELLKDGCAEISVAVLLSVIKRGRNNNSFDGF